MTHVHGMCLVHVLRYDVLYPDYNFLYSNVMLYYYGLWCEHVEIRVEY